MLWHQEKHSGELNWAKFMDCCHHATIGAGSWGIAPSPFLCWIHIRAASRSLSLSVSSCFKNIPELPQKLVPAAPSPAGRSFGMSRLAAHPWVHVEQHGRGSFLLNEAVLPLLSIQGCNLVAWSPSQDRERCLHSSLPGHGKDAKGFV